tara:strand:- start:3231 stop:4109 length:879 start_codon:yes stop_codon:yes gene_type:complete
MSAVLCGERVDENHVRLIETPRDTASYRAVPYGAIIDTIQERIDKSPWTVASSDYALGRDGMQLFGIMNLRPRSGDPTMARALDSITPSIGFRSSHDKSISVGLVTGASVFVCDNMMFNTSGFRAVRKHTRNVFTDIEDIINRTVGSSEEQFDLLTANRQEMKEISVDRNRGYELLGLAYGQGVVTPHQYTTAVNEWRTPTFAGAFEEEDLWSLYNAITFGLKKGAVSEVVKRYTNAHSWATNLMGELDHGPKIRATETSTENHYESVIEQPFTEDLSGGSIPSHSRWVTRG